MDLTRLMRIRSPALVAALVGFLIGYPQLEGVVSRLWLAVGFGLVLVLAAYTIGTDRKHLVRASILGVPAVLGGLILGSTHPLGSVASNVLQLVFLTYVIGVLSGFLLRPGKIDFEKLSAAAAVYLLLGIAWATSFKIVELRHPGSFALPEDRVIQLSDLLYFSYVTITTLGYGDVTPVTDYARSLAIVEAIMGTFFMAVLVARLVSMYGQHTGRA